MNFYDMWISIKLFLKPHFGGDGGDYTYMNVCVWAKYLKADTCGTVKEYTILLKLFAEFLNITKQVLLSDFMTS